MRRVALPLALSLLAHAALVGLLWLCPGPADAPRGRSGDHGPALRLSLAAWERPRPAPPRPLNEDWNIDAEPPKIIPAAAVVGEAPSPPVVPASAPGGGEPEVPAHGGGVGLAVAPAGSSLLPVPKRAQKIVYLLDHSASMGLGGALERAVAEVKLSLRSLPPDALFQVFAYNRLVTPLVPVPAGLVSAAPDRVALATVALDDLGAAWKTDHVAALRRGLALRPDLLFLVTDAADLTERDILVVTNANKGGSAIHVIELTPAAGPADAPQARLAATNGGTYRRVHPGR
jgi:hypothetical protein